MGDIAQFGCIPIFNVTIVPNVLTAEVMVALLMQKVVRSFTMLRKWPSSVSNPRPLAIPRNRLQIAWVDKRIGTNSFGVTFIKGGVMM